MRFRPARVSEESGDDAPTTEIQATLTVIGKRNAGAGRVSLFGVRVVGRARRSVGDAVPATGGARAGDDKGQIVRRLGRALKYVPPAWQGYSRDNPSCVTPQKSAVDARDGTGMLISETTHLDCGNLRW